MLRTNKRLILAPTPKDGVYHIIENLNVHSVRRQVLLGGKMQTVTIDYIPLRTELRRMVDLWLASKRNLRVLFDSDRELAKELHTFRAQLIPDQSGAPRLSILTAPQGDGALTSHNIALALFLDFLLNPVRDSLGGPCKECGGYYFKPTKRRDTFCSPKCGAKYTSRKANQGRYQRERVEIIERAKRGIKNWLKTSRRVSCKEYIHQTELISKNLLTRAEKNGELTIPQ